MKRRRTAVLAIGGAAVLGASLVGPGTPRVSANSGRQNTVTPIRHVVVIYQENVSFDHYFGTYPNAANAGDGQPFTAAAGTPAVDGLLPATDASIPAALQHSADLTTTNPNSALPKRLDATAGGIAGGPGGQITCDQDHNYSDEQQAFDGGGMDRFVQSLGTDGGSKTPGTSTPCDPKIVMDYYDGNTVPAMWNYAQQFAMSDNSYGTTFGPSSPGGLNVTSGNSGGVDMTHTVNAPSVATPTKPNADITADGTGGFSLTSDAQPYWDDCSTRDAVAMSGQNVGDELNAAGVSWGWFEGGMKPTTSYADALAATGNTGQSTATFKPDEFKGAGFQNGVPHSTNQGLCDAVHPVGAAFGATIGTAPWGYKDDYIPHHEPFMYYASTANPHHLSLATDASGSDTLGALGTIGTDTQSYVDGAPQFDTPNHNYDTSDFDQLMAAITRGDLSPDALPAVSYLKAPGYQDGHGAYSDPADEQRFVTREINALMASPDWPSTAVIINYDDSDGWYDHANPGVLNPSLSPADNLTATNATLPTSQQCGPMPQTSAPLAGQQGRCGFGPRLPMMVISPFAKHNAVDHDLSDQASVVNFIEYNWGLPGISGSADQLLASLDGTEGAAFDLAGLFDFRGRTPRMFLDPSTGQPVSRDSLP